MAMNERKWFYREYKSQSNKYGINVKLESFMEISISKQEDSFSPLGGFGIWDFCLDPHHSSAFVLHENTVKTRTMSLRAEARES